MKQLQKLLLLTCTALLLAACGGDDSTSDRSAGNETPAANDDTATNTSGNPYVVVQGASNDTKNVNKNVTGVKELDERLEVPRIMGGKNYYTLIRTVPTYGVNYIIEWDNQKRSQRWAAFQWYNGNSGTSWKRGNWDRYSSTNQWVAKNMAEYGFSDPFQPDPDLPSTVRTELSQYKGSGYSRGHIIASADRLNSMEANEQTFYLSNIMPQTNKLNTGTWEDMENQLRLWNTSDYRKTMYVVKGGTIGDHQTLGQTSTGLTIPRYFFMAILSERNGSYNGMAFILEHTNPSGKGTTLKNYVFTIDQLEELTGIDFFCNLPDNVENDVESHWNESFWKFTY